MTQPAIGRRVDRSSLVVREERDRTPLNDPAITGWSRLIVDIGPQDRHPPDVFANGALKGMFSLAIGSFSNTTTTPTFPHACGPVARCEEGRTGVKPKDRTAVIPTTGHRSTRPPSVLREPTPKCAHRGSKRVRADPDDSCGGSVLTHLAIFEEEVDASLGPTQPAVALG